MTGGVVSMPVRSAQARRDAGAATVLTIGVILMCTSVLAGGLEVAVVVATSHRAAAAADLAALAGAQESLSEPTAGCQAAARVAALNGGELDGCWADPDAVTVWVSVRSAGPWPLRAVARSRAGPADGHWH
ncbi:MAG: Rv3654c family TadE-like protein [Dermatophilaceae bacterium]